MELTGPRVRAARRLHGTSDWFAPRLEKLRNGNAMEKWVFRPFVAASHQAGRAGIWTQYWIERSVDLPGWLMRSMRTAKPVTLPADAPPFLIVGHRGSPRNWVENTIESLGKAMEGGRANALEIDVSLTKDDEVVLWHDWDPGDTVALARQAGLEPDVKYKPSVPGPLGGNREFRRPVRELTLADVREHNRYVEKSFFFDGDEADAHIPTLGEVFEFANDRGGLDTLFLDIKIPEDGEEHAEPMMAAIRALLTEHEPEYAVILLTPHEGVLQAMQDADPGLSYSYDAELPKGVVKDVEDHSAIKAAIRLGNRTATVGRPVLTIAGWRRFKQLVAFDVDKQARFNGRHPDRAVDRLVAWTINDKAEMNELIALGVGGILTDRPRRLWNQLNS